MKIWPELLCYIRSRVTFITLWWKKALLGEYKHCS